MFVTRNSWHRESSTRLRRQNVHTFAVIEHFRFPNEKTTNNAKWLPNTQYPLKYTHISHHPHAFNTEVQPLLMAYKFSFIGRQARANVMCCLVVNGMFIIYKAYIVHVFFF